LVTPAADRVGCPSFLVMVWRRARRAKGRGSGV